LRVLIVEDEPTLGTQLKNTLEGAGYAVDLATDGEDGHYLGSTENYDAIILDLGLPEIDGLTVLDRWRKEGKVTPVLVLTARDSWSDKVAGLDAGADDFISKPASAEIIRARVMANLRRTRPSQAQERFQTWGVYRFDRLEQSVSVNGTPTALTPKEFALSLLLFENLQRPLSRTYLLQRLWNNTIDLSTRTLDMHISKMRTKLCLRPENGFRLQTLSGYGYRLDTYNGNSPETD